MKRKLFTLALLISINLCFIQVKAATCNYEEQIKISGIAQNAKVEYMMNEYQNEYYDPTYDETITDSTWGGIVYIYNMTPEIKVEIVDRNNKKYNYYYSDADSDGVIALSSGLANEVKNYTVNIYAVNTECGKDALKTVNITIPRYNRYSLYPECSDYPDYYYCKDFVTLEDISEENFNRGLSDYKKQQEEKKQEEEKKQNNIIYKTQEFVKENKMIIIPIVIVLVIVGGLIIFRVIKKRRERLV